MALGPHVIDPHVPDAAPVVDSEVALLERCALLVPEELDEASAVEDKLLVLLALEEDELLVLLALEDIALEPELLAETSTVSSNVGPKAQGSCESWYVSVWAPVAAGAVTATVIGTVAPGATLDASGIESGPNDSPETLTRTSLAAVHVDCPEFCSVRVKLPA